MIAFCGNCSQPFETAEPRLRCPRCSPGRPFQSGVEERRAIAVDLHAKGWSMAKIGREALGPGPKGNGYSRQAVQNLLIGSREVRAMLKEKGGTLRSLREAAGLSSRAAAKALDITKVTLKHYEDGQTEPRVSMLRKMAELYGVDADQVLSATPNP